MPNINSYENEPNDYSSQAQQIFNGEVVQGSFKKNHDVDYYKIKFNNSGRTEFSVEPANSNAYMDISMEVKKGKNGEKLGRSWTGYGKQSLTIDTTSGIDYYIKVMHFDGDLSNKYLLKVVNPNEPISAHPNNPSPGGSDDITFEVIEKHSRNSSEEYAQLIKNDDDVDGRVDERHDVDWYKVKFNKSGKANFWVRPRHEDLDVDIAIFKAKASNGSLYNGIKPAGKNGESHEARRGKGLDDLVCITVEAGVYYYIKIAHCGKIPSGSKGNQYWLRCKFKDNWYSYFENGWRTTLGFNGRSSGSNRGHLGNDLVNTARPEVKAIYDGTIVSATYAKWNGNVVHVKHEINGKIFYSFYAHLSKITKRNGTVKAGETIGIMGGTGNNGAGFAPHVHLGIFKGAAPSSGDTQGYFRVNGNKTYFDNYDGNGFKDFAGRRFFDPVKVIETQGQIIVNKYSCRETPER
jgi:murein DD-endopeptidase MepM/ murein hydrolase activator NlpD